MLTISILPNKILKPVQSAVRQEFTHIRSNSLSYLNVGIFVRVHNANEGHITAELVADLIFWILFWRMFSMFFATYYLMIVTTIRIVLVLGAMNVC